VRESVGEMADVLVMDVDVASFITPKMLREAAPAGYNIILIPGAITADFVSISREPETKIRLGPKHAVDLRRVLPLLSEVELSCPSASTPSGPICLKGDRGGMRPDPQPRRLEPGRGGGDGSLAGGSRRRQSDVAGSKGCLDGFTRVIENLGKCLVVETCLFEQEGKLHLGPLKGGPFLLERSPELPGLVVGFLLCDDLEVHRR